MNADEFRKEIMEHYKAALQDCQIPTGALAQLNPTEYYAFWMRDKAERLEAENMEFRDRLGKVKTATDELMGILYNM